MKPLHILFLIVGYFSVLILISFITGRKATNDTFFKANNSSPWYLVAFGMIGASLSGVTFISVPGWVENQSMSYMQMVFGYIVGYAVIGLVLLPLYYQLNLTSIYTYLEDRFGRYSYKTGASFFLLSRTIGAAFRLFLVANVLQLLLFDEFGIPFWFTVTITILLIWLYTFKGGIKTIVWTDTLQTLFMLIAVGVCIYTISDEMNISNIFSYIADNELSKTFFFEDYKTGNYFWKRFFSGAFIAIGHKPITGFLGGQVEVDGEGYILHKKHTMTSVEGVFAAGDVVDTRYKQAITAAGMGCQAAIDVEKWLEDQH